MKKQVKVTFREAAQIIATHLANKGALTGGIMADISWHCANNGLEDSYIIFEQEAEAE